MYKIQKRKPIQELSPQAKPLLSGSYRHKAAGKRRRLRQAAGAYNHMDTSLRPLWKKHDDIPRKKYSGRNSGNGL